MIEEKFVSGRSFIHGLSPAVRILSAMVLSVSAALCDSLQVGAGYLVVGISLVAMARLNFVDVIQRLKPLFGFLLMIWVLLPLTFDGETALRLGVFTVSYPGLLLCAKISLKSVSILLMFTALIATMSVASLGSGLHRIHVPDKMVFLLLMSYRYIAVIQKEYQRLLRAARFRGFVPGTNLHSYRTFAFLAGMLFVRASLRARRVHQAMLCRGFNRTFYTLDVYPPHILNWIFLIGTTMTGLGLVLLELFWMH